MGGGAWPFLVGGAICLVNSVNERDLNLLNSRASLSLVSFTAGGGGGQTGLGGRVRYLHGDVLGRGRHRLDILGVWVAGLVGLAGLTGLRGLTAERLGRRGRRRVHVVLARQAFVVDDGPEQRPHVGGTRRLVTIFVGDAGRHGHKGNVAGIHALHRLAQLDEVLGPDSVDVAVADEHVHHAVELAQREKCLLRNQRAQQRGQKQLLALDPPVVAVVLGGDVASSDVIQRGLGVDQLASGVGQHGAQFIVLQRGGAAHLYA